MDLQAPESLYLTTVNLAELLDGVARLPDGRRRQALERALREAVLPLFAGRILPFDEAAAKAFATVNSRAHSAGLGVGLADAYIAAIARARGFAVASRDGGPFSACGVPWIDPWAAA